MDSCRVGKMIGCLRGKEKVVLEIMAADTS